MLVDVRFESLTGEPYGLHVLLDPELDNDGRDDRARTIAGALVANDRRMTSALAASPAFTATSSGYAGTSDPWMDLRDDGSLDAERRRAFPRERPPGRHARRSTASTSQQLTLALGFGTSQVTARRAGERRARRGLRAARRRRTRPAGPRTARR